MVTGKNSADVYTERLLHPGYLTSPVLVAPPFQLLPEYLSSFYGCNS